MPTLYIIGSGGHGATIAEIAVAAGWDAVAFTDNNSARWGTTVLDFPVVGNMDAIPVEARVALGVGDNAQRWVLLRHCLEQVGWTLPVLAHPSAVVSPSAALGAGTVVMAQAVIGTRLTAGLGCIFNTSSSADHDCVFGDVVHLAPGAHLSGNVRVGERTLIGVGACARPGARIGRDCVIGAGGVVVHTIQDGATAYGNPARAR